MTRELLLKRELTSNIFRRICIKSIFYLTGTETRDRTVCDGKSNGKAFHYFNKWKKWSSSQVFLQKIVLTAQLRVSFKVKGWFCFQKN